MLFINFRLISHILTRSNSRGVAESDLYGRDFVPEDDTLFTREALNDIFNREFIDDLDVVLEARDPFFNSALKLVGTNLVSLDTHVY